MSSSAALDQLATVSHSNLLAHPLLLIYETAPSLFVGAFFLFGNIYPARLGHLYILRLDYIPFDFFIQYDLVYFLGLVYLDDLMSHKALRGFL